MAEVRTRVGPAWWSLRVRTTVAAAVVTAVAVALAGWLLLRSIEDTQLAHVKDIAEDQVDEVSRRLEVGVPPDVAVDGTLQVGNGAVTLVQVLDEDGTTVAAGPNFPAGGQQGAIAITGSAGEVFRVQLPPGAPAPGDEGGGTVQEGSGSVPPGARLDVHMLSPSVITSRPLESISREVDAPDAHYTVVAAAPVDEIQRSVNAVRGALWVALPALVALVALAAWWLVGRALHPVEAIRAQVDEISGTTIHRRVPEPASQDEIGRLARTMNAMLGRLEAASTRQRQFVSDASHELRSPVTAIRADLEVALTEGERADWPAVATAVLAEESRLEALLADLLILASGDEAPPPAAGNEPPTPAPAAAVVDLAALARSEARRPHAVPVTVEAASNGTATVAGRSDHLARVVTNLVDNAARHARTKVVVTVARAATPGGDCVRLTVDDDGPGIPAADRERVFERFTRLDDARARDAGGTGLGLAVVRSIAERHRGTAHIEAGPLGGARAVVDLPARRGDTSLGHVAATD
ncbi:MAG TPA: HAMP domain-containing sensor histidine kinase [Acidimicrobiales bacterium]|jgi:signal transduction histidine kinase